MFIKDLMSTREIEQRGCNVALGVLNHDSLDRAQSMEHRAKINS